MSTTEIKPEEENGGAVEVEKEVKDDSEDLEAGAPSKKKPGRASILRSKKSSHVMASSTFRFKNINFVVGKKDNQKHILENVSGKIKHGRVLAVMGPSGAGKTTLINSLTLDAFFGEASGKVTLNGESLTGEIFKKHCFVVKQQDKHWPYLTARETLEFAAGLFDVGEKQNIPFYVDEVIEKMGLAICADTRCARLSGGQQRRLSIAVALLKQPTVLFLDEPTSGLDAAAASNIMEEITKLAKEESLIVMCTIHQPSTKVYNLFDQVMIMSRGREAYAGDMEEAAPYFDSIGHPLPEFTNPAEHFLDLVNSDFSSEEDVQAILTKWDQHKGANPSTHGSFNTSVHNEEEDETKGVSDYEGLGITRQMELVFRRHFKLVIRDPILYVGRCFVFLIMNSVFAFVYWFAREHDADQIFSKFWVQIWFVCVPCNMGVVAVYALNDEFKSIRRESQNGMIKPITYVLGKTILTLPLFIIFGLFALIIPSYLIQDVPWEAFGLNLVLYAGIMFTFESVAETLSVYFEDPIIGMLMFMNYWFGGFLFGGFLIPESDIYWPLKIFYYFMPMSYYVRSTAYVTFIDTPFSDGFTGEQALQQLNNVFPVVETTDYVGRDIGILFAIGAFFKIVYVVGVMMNTAKVAKFKEVN